MFAASNRKEFARDILAPIIENEVSKRRAIQLPTDEQMIEGLKSVLEECSDSIDSNPSKES